MVMRLELTAGAVVRLAKVFTIKYITIYDHFRPIINSNFITIDNAVIFYLVMVEISLYTRNYAEGISWSLSPRCASSKQIEFNVEGRRIYKEICALAIGKSYELSCESYAGNGWLGNFLVIENKAYCKNFQEGSKETTAIKIEGKILLEKLQHTPYAIKLI